MNGLKMAKQLNGKYIVVEYDSQNICDREMKSLGDLTLSEAQVIMGGSHGYDLSKKKRQEIKTLWNSK